MRPALAGVGALALGLSLVVFAPAAMAAAPSGTITSPAAKATVSSNPVDISGTFNIPSGVMDDVQVSVTSTAGNRGTSTDFPGSGTSSQSFDVQQMLAYNGHDVPPDGSGNQSSTVTETFSVAVPPAAPASVHATADNNAHSVAVSWKANTEPDLTGYVVSRKDPGSSGFQPLSNADRTTTTYTDSSAASGPSGTYSYEVEAYRPGGDGKTPLKSPASAPASAQVVSNGSGTGSGGSGTGSGTGSGSGSGSGGSGAGSGSGGTGSASPGTTTKPPPPPPPGGKLAPAPPLPAPARADAGDYNSLLAQARAEATTTSTSEPDPGFNQRLPFQPRTGRELVTVPGGARVLAGGTNLGGDSGESQRVAYEYGAGALLLVVLAMHAFYLKRQADRAVALETVVPLAPPQARPRPRPAGTLASRRPLRAR
jgi:hypothetical protein